MYESLLDLFDEEKARQESPSLASMSLNMWGTCNPTNVLSTIEKTRRFKPLNVELLHQVLEVCSAAGIVVFIYAGTALGVFRENGHMLPHDYDSDLATLEYSDESPHGALSKLANFCLSRDICISGIEGCPRNAVNSTISVEFSNSFSNHQWLFMKGDQIQERPFSGNGGKRAKFTFTRQGLRKVAVKLTQLEPDEISELEGDLASIHVDLFTLSPHPASPEVHLRVNWQRAGLYDSLEKPFLKKDIFPLKKTTFEGLSVLTPANLEGYLTAEYGYLGRDAIYVSSKQQYVKMPQCMSTKLPEAFHKYILENRDDHCLN